MNIDNIEDKMIQALEGELSHSDYSDLMKNIEKDDDLKEMWKSYQVLFQGIEGVERQVPSDKVKDRFYEFLNDYDDTPVVKISHKKADKPLIIWRRWASVAAVLVCVLGFWSMYKSNVEVEDQLADMSKQMESLMDQQSTSERIKAIRVNYNTDNGDMSQDMIGVLIRVLNTDESSNVRLAAVETLTQFMDQEIVREGLIKRLLQEPDGAVKLAIITGLGKQRNDKIKSTLEEIVNDDSQEKFVIDEAHMQLIRFEQTDI